MQNLEKRKPGRQKERKVSSCWNISCLIHSKNFNTNPPNKSTKQNSFWQNEKKSVWNLIQWQEFWIHLTKFDATTRKLNRQYDIQRVKLDFFHDSLPRNVVWYDENTIFGVYSASHLIALMLLDSNTYDINLTLSWRMGVAKSRY